MNMLQEKLNFLLEKYSVGTQATLKDAKTVTIDGEAYSLFAHRSERRFLELKNIVNGGTLVGVSVMRVARILEQGSDLFEALAKEMDLCAYILQRKLKTVMVMQNDTVLNAIATTVDGVVCTLEISATLDQGEEPKDKHEIISQRGIACDVVVDAQLKQDSIYLFGKENQKFTDVDSELYGLSPEEVSVVRAAFAIAKNRNFAEIRDLEAASQAYKAAAIRSVESGAREEI